MSRLQDITTFTDAEINDLDYFWVNEIETSTATLSIASPCVVSKTAHGLEVGNKISFTTTGALPTGITASTNYYIISSGFGANSFRLSATFGGTAINTSGTQSGVHTYTAYVSKKMSGEKLKTLVVPSTPASEVSFDKLTPTTAGVVFTPNTPTTTNILYYSTIDGSTWIYNGTIYKSKAIPNSTEFNIDGIFVDAGSNKTSTISRNGSVMVRENNTLLSKFTQILSYGVSIVSDTFAQISQTAVSTTVYPLTRMTRKRGTITSQTNALSGDTLGVMAWNGGSANDSAQIFAQATENNAGTLGASLYFQTVQTGSSGLSTAFWIDGTAKLNISLGSVYTYATANTLSGFDASKNLVSLSTATYPSLTELSYVKGLTGPVGTLATQSGTFSGTSSGTNTGDQIISDDTITTTDITTNNFTTAKHGFVPKGTNVGNFLKDDGTWASAGGGSGIWGIANASGVYTYYATWALAVAAATSGKVIELFADITESSVSYTLKNGVNINGNGHTITFSNAGNGFDDNNVACTVIFSNINLVKTTASAIIQCFSVSSNIGGYSAFLNVNNAGAWGFYGSGSIWGLSTTGSGLNVLTRAGTTLNISNCYIFGSVNANNGTVLISNCYIKGSGELVSGSPSMNNCTLIATSGVAYTGNNKNITNCSIVSMTSNVISGGGIFENCYIYSAAERPISADSNSQFHNCYIESATLYINQFNTSANYYNCTLKVKLSFLFYGGTQKLYNCTLINEWNTTGVYIFRDCVNNVEVNNYIQVANSGTIINYTASTQTVYMYGNAIKGTSTINSAGITNAQTNLVDLQGNVILN